MSRTFFFLTLLFVTSYCVEKNSNTVNQIIDELVELNKSVRHEPSEIGKLVAQVRAAAHNSAKAFHSFYEKVQNNCKAGSGYLQSFSTKLNGDAVIARNGLDKANARITRNTKELNRLEKDLKSDKAALKAAHKRQRQEGQIFRQYLLEAEAKLTAIRHIRNIVVDELLNAKGKTSLIQVNTISSKLVELKNMLEKDGDPILTTVVSALIEMSSNQNLNDQGILKKFLASLSKLSNRLAAFRKSSIAEHKKIVKIEHANNAAKLKTIRANGRLYVQAKAAISGAQRAIGEFNNALALINRALKRKTTEAKHWNNLCKDQARIAEIFNGAYKHISEKTQAIGKALLGN